MQQGSWLRYSCLAVIILALALGVACTAAPTPTPTSAPAPTKAAAAPTKAAAASTKAAEPTKAAPAPTKPAEAAKPKAPVTVRVGVDPVGRASDATYFIGQEKGYFKEQNIDFQAKAIRVAPDNLQLLATGEIDVGGGSPNAGLFNSIARNIPIQIVADKGTSRPGMGYFALMVRKDLWDSGVIKDITDLRGRKFGTPGGKTASSLAWVDAMLAKQGLSWKAIEKEVELVDLGFANMNPAFAGKSIDFAMQMEPLVTKAVDEGLAVVWKRSDEMDPNGQTAVVLFGAKFAKEQADVARGFAIAHVKAARDYNDAFVKKDPKAYDEIVRILTKHTELKDAAVYQKVVLPGLNPDGALNVASIARDQDWYASLGLVPQKVDLNAVIDQQFVNNAVQVLGRYN